MEILYYVVLLAVLSMIFGGFTMKVADEKGWSPKAWFFAGFFFWFIGLLAAIGLPLKRDSQSTT